jgi:hypothetical protein
MHQAHPLTAASTVHGALQDGSVCIAAELCAEQFGCHLHRYIPIILNGTVLLCVQVTSRQHSGPSAVARAEREQRDFVFAMLARSYRHSACAQYSVAAQAAAVLEQMKPTGECAAYLKSTIL